MNIVTDREWQKFATQERSKSDNIADESSIADVVLTAKQFG